MRKFFLILIASIFFIPNNVFAFDIYSNNGILYNLNDDKIIFSKNENDKVMIASLTKIMTAIVSIENISNLDDYVVMDSLSFSGLDGYALAGFKIGDRVTYRDLLYGLLLPSGAECAYGLALNVSGSVSSFIDLMNEKVNELHLSNTHFSNPIGMDDGNNYSTAYDVALLLKYALDNEIFYDIFKAKEYVATNGVKFESTIKEKSLKHDLDVSKILGSKTGFTDGAGYCLASIASIDGVNYLLVTLGASTNNEYQVMDAINVYSYFSSNYGYKKILNFNQLLGVVDVKNSFRRKYNIYSNIDKFLYLSNDIDVNNLVYRYDGLNELDNVKKGEYIGKISVVYDDVVLDTYDVYLNEDIVYINYFVVGGIVVFIIFLFIISKKIKI